MIEVGIYSTLSDRRWNMAAPRVGVSVGITLNVGNFESVRADSRFDVDVQDGESYDDAWSAAVAEAKIGLDAALKGVEDMLAKRNAHKP
jgi:hypothetical protein